LCVGHGEKIWEVVALQAGFVREKWEKVCVADMEAARSSLLSGHCDVILFAPITANLMADLKFTAPVFSGAAYVSKLRAM